MRVNVALPCVYLVSTGGSSVASDAIRHEVMRLRESGIPVVVSMGNQATSGGYEISGQSCPSHVSFSASHQAQSTTQPICAHRHTWADVLSPNSISMIICFVNTQRVLPGLAVHVWLHLAGCSQMGHSRLCSQLVKLDAQTASW